MINCNISWCKYEHDGKCSLLDVEINWEDGFPVCDNFIRIFTNEEKERIRLVNLPDELPNIY